MSRLILVPQYPSKLRYQQWWFMELPRNYKKHFDEVVTLGKKTCEHEQAEEGRFSPMERAITFETQQIREYLDLELRDDDTLLLCDLSFPGLFAGALFHKRPTRCFAVCHATSKNKFDYFNTDFEYKWPVEEGHAGLFNAIFVATEYHREKLGWENAIVTGLPLPPPYIFPSMPVLMAKPYDIISVARNTTQKRNVVVESLVEKRLETEIVKPDALADLTSWNDYYRFIRMSKVLLITAREETFGYQVIDAVLGDCIPIAPNSFSYPELLPRESLYSTFDELISKLQVILSIPESYPKPKLLNAEQCNDFYERTAQIMRW